VFGLLTLVGCGGASNAPGRALVKVVAAYSNAGADHMSSWIAQEAGIFRKNGLEVELQLGGGGTKTAQALLAGDFQLVEVGGSDVANAAASGADVVVIAAPSQVYMYKLIAAKDIATIADLRGKKVGVSSTGGSGDIAARVVLRRAGLEPGKDVFLVPVGDVATRQAAMLNGAVQAEIDAPPQTSKVEANPNFHVLLDLAAEGLPAANGTIVGRRSWVYANRDTVQKYVDSTIQGAVLSKRDQAFAMRVIQKYTTVDDPQALQDAYAFFSHVITTNPTPKAEQFADTIQVLSELNPELRKLNAASMIDDSFVKDALARGVETSGG
jgi:NitT/TauT family transport system substrate-binding protein